jgi:hypothetical protein
LAESSTELENLAVDKEKAIKVLEAKLEQLTKF